MFWCSDVRVDVEYFSSFEYFVVLHDKFELEEPPIIFMSVQKLF